MPSLAHDGFDSNRPMTMFLKLCNIHTGIMTVPYSGPDVRRMVDVDDSDDAISLEPNESSDDPLSELLVESINELEQSETNGNCEIDISPAASVGTIFAKSKDARDLKGRMWIAYDLRNSAHVCGVLTSCMWHRDSVFLNERFTTHYCHQQKDLPNDLANYWFIDVVSSTTKPAGAMLLLQAYSYAARTRRAGICMIAVTNSGRTLATNLGMSTHHFREDGATRWFCWAPIGSLRLRTITSKLNIGSSTNRVLTEICSRFGLSAATADRVMMRC